MLRDPGPPLWLVFLVASLGLPLVVLPVKVGLWLKRRQWGRVLMLVVLIGLSSVGLAAFRLHQDASLKPPWQSYSWERWYVVLELGFYLWGC